MSAQDICSNCGAAIQPGIASCNSCGTPLARPAGGFCSNCGVPLSDRNAPCPSCGHVKTVTGTSPGRAPPQSYVYKNEGNALILAVVLGFFGINGIGHIYIGKVGRGLWLLIGAFVLFAVGIATLLILVGIVILLAYFGIFIWQILDARRLCREYNEHVQAHGKPPDDW